MNTHTATLGIPEIARPSRYPLNLHLSFIVRWFIDKLLFLIEAILEYALMMHIGAAVGYVVGKCAGYIYAGHCQPDFSPELITQLWLTPYLAPYRFAVYGATIGACFGMMVMMALAIRQGIRIHIEKSLAN